MAFELGVGGVGRIADQRQDGACALGQVLRQRAGLQHLPGVICSNAVVTLRVVAAVARLGWQLGKDLGLLGFDDTEWSPYVGPGISTIAQPTDSAPK